MFVDVPDILVPAWAMFMALGLMAVFFCVALYQFCINAAMKEELKFKCIIMTAAAFEMAFIVTSYVSLYVVQSDAVKLICHFLFFCILIALSYLGYHCVAMPTSLKKTAKVKKLWTLLSILHLIWLLFCLFLLIMTRRIFYEEIYFFGLSLYLISATSTILFVTYHVRRAIMKSIERFRKLSIQMTRKPDTTSPSSPPDGEGNHVALSPPTSTSNLGETKRSSSTQCVDPVKNLIRFQNAKKQIHAVICCAVMVLCLAILFLIWRIFTFRPFEQPQHCTMIKRPPKGPKGDIEKCHPILSYTPFDEVGLFLFHYVCVCTVYIVMMHRYWKSPADVRAVNSVWFKIFGCCLTDSMRRRIRSPPAPRVSISLKVSNRSNERQVPQKRRNKYTETDLDLDEEAKQRTAAFSKRITVQSQLEELDYAAHAELYKRISVAVEKAANISISDKQDSSVIERNKTEEYSHYSRAALSKTHLECNLNNLDEGGHIIGKRGKEKLKKLNEAEKEKRKKEDRTSAIIERMHSSPSLNCVPLGALGNAARSITALSLAARGEQKSEELEDPEAETSPLRTPVFSGTDLMHISEDMMLPDIMEPITTVVMELEYVLCTKAADKLKDRGINFLQEQDEFKKKMYFGGEERLDLLKQWLVNGSQRHHKVKFYIITNEQTKMVVSLLKDVGLLRYFVSINPQNRTKLLSHVIGYDHKMSKQADGKRHLILLELLQFVQMPHASVLYIGNEKEIVEHITSIQICKAYHVKTHGLVEQDLDAIQEKYF